MRPADLRRFLMHFVKGHMLVANVWHLEAKSQTPLNTREGVEEAYTLADKRGLLRRIPHLSPDGNGGIGDVAELTDEGWDALGLKHLNPKAPTKTAGESATLRRRSESEAKPGDVRQAQKSLFE